MQTIQHDVQLSRYTYQEVDRGENVKFRRFQTRVPAPGHPIFVSISMTARLPVPPLASGYAWSGLVMETQGTLDPRPWLLLSWVPIDPDGTGQWHADRLKEEPGTWTITALPPVSVSSTPARTASEGPRVSYYLKRPWMARLERLVGEPLGGGAWLFNRLLPRYCQAETRLYSDPFQYQHWIAL